MKIEPQKFSFDEDLALAEVFDHRLAKTPYCSNDLERHGLKAVPKIYALQRKWIQANHENILWRMIFDIDTNLPWHLINGDGNFDFSQIGVPTPSWFVYNTSLEDPFRYGHAHICYELTAPVSKSSASRRHPLDFFKAAKDGLFNKLTVANLNPDPGYGDLTCKNPRVGLGTRATELYLEKGQVRTYELGELFECGIHYKKSVKQKPGSTEHFAMKGYGESWRCDLFHDLRLWAYANRRNFSDQEQFTEALLRLADSHNRGLTDPHKYSTLKSTARSVSRSVWDYFTPAHMAASDARFSALQAHRGKNGGMASGKVRYEQSMDARNQARNLAAEGKNQAEIALILGKNRSTVCRWLRD